MAYIPPNTNIIIYKEMPLDNTYENTLWYDSPTDQYNDFLMSNGKMANKVLCRLDQHMYQRVSDGVIRVHLPWDSGHFESTYNKLYDANYLAFQNASFASKWFFAFVTSVEYINNEVVELTYEIDVMQTYLFDVVVGPSFVERQHTAKDDIGANIIDEGLDIGDEYVIAEDELSQTGTIKGIENKYYPPTNIAFITSKVKQHDIYNPDYVASEDVRYPNGVYVNRMLTNVGICTCTANQTNFENAVKAINQTLNYENVLNCFMYPSELNVLIPEGAKKNSLYESEEWSTGVQVYNSSKDIGEIPSLFRGYRPKNKKLYSYPYSLILGSNYSGDTAEYKWEDFNTSEHKFTIHGAILPEPQLRAYPAKYRGLDADYENALTVSNYPTVAFNGDVFKAYMSTHKGQIGMGLLTSAVSGFTAYKVATTPSTSSHTKNRELHSLSLKRNNKTGRMVKSSARDLTDVETTTTSSAMSPARGPKVIADTLAEITGQLASINDAKYMPNSLVGSFTQDGIRLADSKYGFCFYKLQIKPEYAKIIDDFFTMFGYKENKIATVNRNVRPVFTYTKTIGCAINSGFFDPQHLDKKIPGIKYGAPVDAVAMIKDIYDNGIRFWKNVNNVNNYSLDNRPN